MRGCSNGGVAIMTASISGALSSFSKSLYVLGFCSFRAAVAFSMRSSNRSHSAETRARGSPLTMVASYVPRPPEPISPTLIFELACEPRTAWGATIVNVVAAAEPMKSLRETKESAMPDSLSPVLHNGPSGAAQGALQGFEEKIIAPDHGFIHAQLAVEVINAALQHAFPARIPLGHVALAQGAQNPLRGSPIKMSLHRILGDPAQPVQSGCRNGSRGCVQQRARLGRGIEIPRWNAVGVAVRSIVFGARLGGRQKSGIARIFERRDEAV